MHGVGAGVLVECLARSVNGIINAYDFYDNDPMTAIDASFKSIFSTKKIQKSPLIQFNMYYT